MIVHHKNAFFSVYGRSRNAGKGGKPGRQGNPPGANTANTVHPDSRVFQGRRVVTENPVYHSAQVQIADYAPRNRLRRPNASPFTDGDSR